jgi:hypothetical protein
MSKCWKNDAKITFKIIYRTKTSRKHLTQVKQQVMVTATSMKTKSSKKLQTSHKTQNNRRK